MSRRPRRGMAAAGLVAALVLGSCSSDDGATGAAEDTEQAEQTEAAMTDIERPEGPAADLSEELTGGQGPFIGSSTVALDLESVGWVESEHVAAGTATSYASAGELPADGRAELTPAEQAGYRTRILVRRPAAPDAFDGTVVVEWLNVSGGLDASPDFSFLGEELARRGMAWVGVSAQLIGVEGGNVAVGADAGAGVAGRGLKGIDPERYGTLQHPGDAFSYDIFTQVARALRADGSGGVMGDLDVQRVLAVGESQSGFALTTYVNGVHPLVRQYDGFLIHSRGGAAMPLGQPGEAVSIASAIVGTPTIVRTDQDVPVLIFETETDLLSVLGYHAARQDDTDHLRLWEAAGTAHADRTLIGPLADSIDCGVPINDGPQVYVVRAALRALDTWVRTGEAPPSAPRLEIDESGGGPAMVRDADGNARGGIRLPHVEVPVATLSGDPGPNPSSICLLLGSTRAFTPERLAELYPSAEDYLDRYAEAADAAIAAGFALPEDRDAILADAQPSAVPG